jgi:hypothetical protein
MIRDVDSGGDLLLHQCFFRLRPDAGRRLDKDDRHEFSPP